MSQTCALPCSLSLELFLRVIWCTVDGCQDESRRQQRGQVQVELTPALEETAVILWA